MQFQWYPLFHKPLSGIHPLMHSYSFMFFHLLSLGLQGYRGEGIASSPLSIMEQEGVLTPEQVVSSLSVLFHMETFNYITV